MTSYICIGKGKTDANGVAQLTHDCQGNVLQSPGYVGQGKGKLNVVASTDSPSSIGESSLVSPPYEICDAVFYDPLTSTTLNSNWYNAGAFGLVADSTGAEFTNNNSSNHYLLITDGVGSRWSNTYDWDNNYKYSFEIVSYSGHVFYKRGTDGGNEIISSTGNVTVEITSTSKIQAGFMISPNAKLKIKNIKLYPK